MRRGSAAGSGSFSRTKAGARRPRKSGESPKELLKRLRHEPVADPRLRHDVARAGGVGLDLLAQRAHVDAHGVRARARRSVPDAADDLADGHGLAGLRAEKLENREFGGCELHLAPAGHDATPLAVDGKARE